MSNIQNNVFHKIKTGEVSMVPRWQFVLHGVLWASATILVALIAVYLFSFVLFALRESGVLYAPQFGLRGVMLFVVYSPWVLLGCLGVFLLVLYVLVSRYEFSYRKPLVYSIVGLVVIVIGASALIQATRFHSTAGAFAERHNVPLLGPLYQGTREGSQSYINVGMISELTDDSFMLTTLDDSKYIIVIDDRTRLPRRAQLSEGDEVRVYGAPVDGVITAIGVRPIEDLDPTIVPREDRRPRPASPLR